jgi:hypothetical protein
MEAWQVAGLVSVAGALALLLPGARRMLASGAPVWRWALIWVVALAAAALAYELVLAPLGVTMR